MLTGWQGILWAHAKDVIVNRHYRIVAAVRAGNGYVADSHEFQITPQGTALIDGFDVARQADDVRKVIGVIPQAMTSDLELSVEENLLIFAKLYGVPR